MVAVAGAVTACAQDDVLPSPTSADDSKSYGVEYVATFEPSRGVIAVDMNVTQSRNRLISAVFVMPEPTYDVDLTDAQTRQGDEIVWSLGGTSGVLSYRVAVDSTRRNGKFDARMTPDFAIFRGDDVFPPVRTRAKKSANSKTSLRLVLPAGWSAETPYGRFEPGASARPVSNPERKFDRPVGWMIAGDIGVRRERIAGSRIVVAAPREHGFRRNDVLAFLNWTLPSLVEVVELPKRVLIVGADEGFWRGGLSASNSLYLHADRPLISENDTSTLLHEMVHVGTGLRARGDDDWIVEGIAEYYSFELMRRSGTISQRRFEDTIADLRRRGGTVESMKSSRANGAVKARAAVYFADLDSRLRASGRSLDEVVRRLVETKTVSQATLDAEIGVLD